jgi:Asp-tRNA(Asn)/Glu-tRNA(Gln) amidotransferase B subunit
VGALSDGRLTHAHAEILWAAWRDAGGDLTARVEAALAAGGADADAWEAAVREVVESSPAVVARVRAGHLPALNVLVGQALRHLGGQADAAQVRTRLRRALALDPDEDA